MDIEPKASSETTFEKFIKTLTDAIEGPVIWFRENVVVPNRREYPWYHENLPRVPTVDECYEDDSVCIFEAEQQFKRDRAVDGFILQILKKRFHGCVVENRPDEVEMCQPLFDEWQNAITNYFIKYGDLGISGTCRDAYMKQKHRMVWERRHGPVGTGMLTKEEYHAKKKREAQKC